MKINRKARIELPLIYLRTESDDLTKYGVNLLIPHRKRDTIEELKEDLIKYLRKSNNKFIEQKITSILYRIFDECVIISDMDDRKDIYLSCLCEVNNFIKSYKQYSTTIELACKTYRPRNIQQAISHYDDRILQYLFKNLNFNKQEMEILDWAEQNIPGIINKTLAAILNENSFLSLNYFLPIETYITASEKQRLYKFRRIILNKLYVYPEKQYHYYQHKSPKLYYSPEHKNLIFNIFKKVWLFPDIKYMSRTLKEISSKIKNLKVKILDNVIYLNKLLHQQKSLITYSDIFANLSTKHRICDTILSPANVELLSLYSKFRELEKWFFRYKDRMVEILFYEK